MVNHKVRQTVIQKNVLEAKAHPREERFTLHYMFTPYPANMEGR